MNNGFAIFIAIVILAAIPFVIYLYIRACIFHIRFFRAYGYCYGSPRHYAAMGQQPPATDPATKLRPHTVRYADGSTRTVWSEADAKALTTWGGATSYKGAGDLHETHRVNPFFKNPFRKD